jgi:hypothetical protein
LVSQPKGRTQIEDVSEQGAEENNWTEGRGSNRRWRNYDITRRYIIYPLHQLLQISN